MQSADEKLNTGDKINDFIQKNRKGIFISFGILVLLFIGFIAYFFISDSINKQAISEIEELNRKYINLQLEISEGNPTEEVEALIVELNEFAGKYKNLSGSRGFATSKAWSLIAQIYTEREDWPQAEEAWLNSASTGAKTFLGPIALFQAAVVCEEQGKIERAIELFLECLESDFDFPAAPRAQFSVGRLYEQIGDFDSAIEAYRNVQINWSDIPIWQQLARSRIIAIEPLSR